MADSSFDVVSKVDRQEVDNAVNQARKEVGSRFDFRNTGADIEHSGDVITLTANTEERVAAVLDVLQSKMIKRGVSLKSLDVQDAKASGKDFRQSISLKEGLDADQAKKISKIVREEGPKSVKASIQGDELRVTSKSRDDLQSVISLLKGQDLDVALQFVNYR